MIHAGILCLARDGLKQKHFEMKYCNIVIAGLVNDLSTCMDCSCCDMFLFILLLVSFLFSLFT